MSNNQMLTFESQCDKAYQELYSLFVKIIHRQEQEQGIILVPISIGRFLSQYNISFDVFLSQMYEEILKTQAHLSDSQKLAVKNMSRRLWQQAVLPLEVAC